MIDISVIVTVWNRAKFLVDALESIKNQDFEGSTQVVVCDDGSVDETPSVIEQFRDSFTMYNVVNGNPTDEERITTSRCAIQINKAIPLCHGKYICYLPDDDIYLPQRNRVMFNFMESHPDIFLAYHWMKLILISEDKAVVGQAVDLCEMWDEATKYWVKNIYNRIDHTSLFHRNLFENNILWNEDLNYKRCVDWGFLLKVLDLELQLDCNPMYLAVGRKIQGKSLNIDGDKMIGNTIRNMKNENLLCRC